MIIGSDVEFFVRNSLGDVIPAYTVIDHDKNDPIVNQDIKLYYDNVLLEFNIPPCKSIREFIENIESGINFAESKIRPHFLDTSASTYFSPEFMSDSRSQVVACDIEYNAYNMQPNYFIQDALKNTSMRTSGGHLHLSGVSSDSISDKTKYPLFVYMLDLFLGISSLLVEKDQTQKDRRKFFGKAGSFRIKPYGIEYRVLSSWWTRKPEYCGLVYRICEFVFEFMNNDMWQKFWTFNVDNLYNCDPSQAYECFGYDLNFVTKTINECDYKSAEVLFNFISNFMPNDIVEEINFQIKK